MKQILLALCVLITFNISGQEKEKGKSLKIFIKNYLNTVLSM